jgi:hypothetical protein
LRETPHETRRCRQGSYCAPIGSGSADTQSARNRDCSTHHRRQRAGTPLGFPGGGLGYGSDHVGGPLGLPRSLAIKFDIYNNSGEGINSTGIFTNGRSPTVRDPALGPGFPDASVDLTGTGIDLHSSDPFQVNLTYDGTTLTETITDTVTHATFTTSYVVNIPGLLGSDVGYMGFTGGTGGLTAVQDVTSWTINTTLPRPVGDPQLAADGQAPDTGAPALSAAELAPVAEQAVANLAATGLSAADVARLSSVQYQIRALGNGLLGLTNLGSNVVVLDSTAAGYGWFVDPTPADNSEFALAVAPSELQADISSPAFGRMDLLTVVEHELEHVLGVADLNPQTAPDDLMTETLAPGVRRLPGPVSEPVLTSPGNAGATPIASTAVDAPVATSQADTLAPIAQLLASPAGLPGISDPYALVAPGLGIVGDEPAGTATSSQPVATSGPALGAVPGTTLVSTSGFLTRPSAPDGDPSANVAALDGVFTSAGFSDGLAGGLRNS